MTPATSDELQALKSVVEHNTQILVNLYWLMFSVLMTTISILFSKIIMHSRLFEQGQQLRKIFTESRLARHTAEMTEQRAIHSADEVKEEVLKVPEKVVQAIGMDGAGSLAANPSGTSTPRP